MTRRTLGGLFWIFSSSGLQSLLKVVFIAILARLLIPEDFGLMSAAAIIVGFARLTSRIGVGEALVQLPEIDERHVRSAFTFTISTGLLLSVALWAASPLVASLFEMPALTDVLRILVWIFPLQAISSVSFKLIQRQMNYRRLAGVDVISYLLGFGAVGITLAYLGFGVDSLVWATLAQTGIAAMIYYTLQPHSPLPLIDLKSLKQLLFFGSGFTLGSVLNFAARRGDNLVVARWLGADALGFYSRAYGLMDASNSLFGNVINKVFFPAFARLQADPDRLATAYQRSITLISLVMLPVSVASIILAPEIVMVLLGDQWSEVILPFQILAAGMLLRLGYKAAGTMARGCGAVYRMAWIQGVYTFLAIGGAWVGHRWGVAGVASSTLLALTVQFLLLHRLCLKIAGRRWRDLARALTPAIIPSIFVGALITGLAIPLRNLATPPIILLPAVGAVVAVALTAVFLLAPRLIFGTETAWLLLKVIDTLPPHQQGLVAFARRRAMSIAAKLKSGA